MRKSTKAALLSALVFPGTGHLYLKKYIRGILLFGVSSLSIFSIIAKTVESALQVAEKIQNSSVQPDMAAITALISQQLGADGVSSINFTVAIFILCWLFGIIDSYRMSEGESGP